jgi:hypothetical protein
LWDAFLDESDRREYAVLRRRGLLAGLLPGTGSSLIPMDVVSLVDNERGSIEVLASKETVKDSPSVDTSRGLSAERAAEVRGYYRL